MLDPILVNTLMGRDQRNELQELKPIASTRARDGNFEDPEIAEEVASITGRSNHKRRGETR